MAGAQRASTRSGPLSTVRRVLVLGGAAPVRAPRKQCLVLGGVLILAAVRTHWGDVRPRPLNVKLSTPVRSSVRRRARLACSLSKESRDVPVPGGRCGKLWAGSLGCELLTADGAGAIARPTVVNARASVLECALRLYSSRRDHARLGACVSATEAGPQHQRLGRVRHSERPSALDVRATRPRRP